MDNDKIKLVLSVILGINSLELSLNLSKNVSEDLVNKYKEVIENIKNGKPVQYALSNACFYGYDYYVNENVLIPRFETEELVFHCINYINKYFYNPNVLDLCAGSGCIGLTLKKECPNMALDVRNSQMTEEEAYIMCYSMAGGKWGRKPGNHAVMDYYN